MKVNNISNAKRCEKCHQSDCFDPLANTCFRCDEFEKEAAKAVQDRPRRPTERKQGLIDLVKYIIKASLVISLISILGSVIWLYRNGVIPSTPPCVCPLPQLDPIFELVEVGAYGSVESLVHEQPRRLSLREPKRGWSPLHLAVYLGNEKVINALMAKGANVSALDRRGNQALHIWAMVDYKNEDILNLLLSRGTRIDALNASNQSLLHLAAENGRELPIKRFIQELDKKSFYKTTQIPVTRDTYSRRGRRTGTETVWESRTTEDLDAKKSYISSFLDARDNSGETPLLKVCKLPSDKWAIANNLAVMLVNKGASIDLDNSAKVTPLLAACSTGNTSLVKLLIQRGANLYVTDDKGNTPLHYAVLSGANDLVEYLIIRKLDTNAKNAANETPEALAIKLKKYDVAQLFSIYRTNTNSYNALPPTTLNTSKKQGKESK